MTAPKLVPAIRRIAERATHEDELAILALLALCERQHKALNEIVRCGDSLAPLAACSVVAALTAGRDAGLHP